MIKILKSPWAMLAGIIAGVLIGLFARPLVTFLKPFSQIYLSLLQMCVLPIVACTVCINIGRLFSGTGRGIAARFLTAIVVTLLAAALIGTVCGFWLRGYMTPGAEAKLALAQLDGMSQSSTLDQFHRIEFYGEPVSQTAANAESGVSAIDFLLRAVPVNIFAALASGQTMQVLLFFALLGIMLGKVSPSQQAAVIHMMEGIYGALCELVNRILLLLPLALCAMLAEQFAADGMTAMAGPLLRLIIVIYLAVLVIIALNAVLIQYLSGCTWRQHWQAIKRTLFIALGTSSCMASIPSALEDCPAGLGLDKTITDSVLPISITMCQSGVVACGAIAAVFATTIYDVPINGSTVSIIILGAIVFSLSIIGVPGIVAVNMLSIILEPLGIPPQIIILIYLVTIPIFDPVSVFASVYSNFAVAGFVAGRNKKGGVKA